MTFYCFYKTSFFPTHLTFLASSEVMKNAINQLPKRAEFIKILSASFISQSGSHILTLALATFVFISSGSPVKSSLVFVFAFFPSILVSSQLGSWIDRSISRSFLVYIEILSILASVLCGIVVFYKLPLSLLCIVLGLRSILTFTSRTADSKWVKCITDLRFQASRMRLMFFISFLSTGCAGILAALALQKYSFIWVVLLDIITYIFGILFLVSLQDISQKYRNKLSHFTTKQNDLITTIKTIFIRPKIRTHFILVCLSQAIFQGAYCSLISVLPILRFDLGSSGVGMFQVATSIGIILGFIVNWYWSYLLASTKY